MPGTQGSPIGQRIPEHKWLTYFEGLTAGLTRYAACERAGISTRSADTLHANPTRSSGWQYYKEWLEAHPRDVTPRNRLNPHAKRALKDFGFFRERYFGHISRPWHVQAAETMLKLLYDDDKSFVVVNCPPGCLTGDTIVTINRNGAAKQIRLDHLEFKFNGGVSGGKSWNPDIPTRMSRAVDGFERLGLVRSVYASGVKEVFALTTAAGHTIRASAEHRFLRPDGTYTELADLSVGDEVMVLGGRGAGRAPKKQYASTQTAYHPCQRRAKDGFRYWVHRLVMEAHLNGLPYDEFVYALRAQPVRCKEFVFLTPDDVVHHLDEDHTNNALSNLALTTHAAHKKIHSAENTANVLRRIVPDVIASITYAGKEDTYDVEMADGPPNFIADKIAVHNSGKTTLF